MPKGLVGVSDGRVVFGEAVSRIAESLNPLGAAGRIIAESYALTTEMRRINLERTQAADDKEIVLALLDQRRRESSSSLQQMQHKLGQDDITAQALRECMVNMQRETVKPGLPPEVLIAFVDLTKDFTTRLVQHHTEQAGELTLSLDNLLNGAGATALVPAARKSGSGPKPVAESAPKPASREGSGKHSAAGKQDPTRKKTPQKPRDDGRKPGRRG